MKNEKADHKSQDLFEHMEDVSSGEVAHTKAVLEHDSIEYTTPGPLVWICAAATAISLKREQLSFADALFPLM